MKHFENAIVDLCTTWFTTLNSNKTNANMLISDYGLNMIFAFGRIIVFIKKLARFCIYFLKDFLNFKFQYNKCKLFLGNCGVRR